MEIDKNAGNQAAEGESAAMSFPQRLVGIFFEPTKTFEDIRRKRSWLGIFLVVVVFVVGSSCLLMLRIDPVAMTLKAMESNPFTKNMSEEQKMQAAERAASPVARYSGLVVAPFVMLLVYVIVASALLLAFVLMGASLRFKDSLAVTIWGFAPPTIISMVLAGIFVLLKDPDSLDPNIANNVVSNPGIAVDAKAQPFLQSLLGSLDIFSFWSIFLLAVGYSVMTRGTLTFSRAATGVILAWVLWVLGKAAFALYFS